MQNTTIAMLRKCSQAIARVVMPEKAWAYYSSAADDEITNRENHAAYHRIWWRPRILRDVTNVDYSTKILGFPSKMPLYIVSRSLNVRSPSSSAHGIRHTVGYRAREARTPGW